MDKKASNFSVVSKVYCFLCLNIISPQFDTNSSSVSSFQDVSRYLKLDMSKVFIQGGPIPSHLLAKIKKSNLKVELCSGCSKLTRSISKRCRQLEKLKMEIESGLESIHGKIMEADETGRTEQFRKVVGSEVSSGMGGGLDILEVLRLETRQKCFKKINTASPRLQIQTLTSKEIRRRTFRIPKNEADTTSEQMSDSGEQRSSIKMEEPDRANSMPDYDENQSEKSFTDDLHHEIEESDSGSYSVSVSAILKARGANNESIERKCSINSETGKFKCGLCPMEFATRAGFYSHYNTIHRKLKIRCKICGKEFTQKGHYERHHQGVHLGIRFQCIVCKKSFSQKGDLTAHQRKAGCATGRKAKR